MLVESFVAADGLIVQALQQRASAFYPARPDANSERIQKEKVERLFRSVRKGLAPVSDRSRLSRLALGICQVLSPRRRPCARRAHGPATDARHLAPGRWGSGLHLQRPSSNRAPLQRFVRH